MIYKRNGNYWCDIQVKGKRLRRSLNTDNRENALRLHARLDNNLWEERELGIFRITWAEACKLHNNKSELFDLRLGKGYVKRHNADTKWVSEITQEELDFTLENMGPIAQNRYQAHLRAVLNTAKKHGYEVPNLVYKFNKESSRTRVLSDTEVISMIYHLPLYLRRPCWFALYTGLRSSTIKSLQWKHVDMFNKTLKLGAELLKNKTELTIPIDRRAFGILAAELEDDHFNKIQPDDYVFYKETTTATLAPIKLKTLTPRSWYTAVKKAGLTDVRFHDLRRTWASNLRKKGVPRETIMALGGWKTSRMLDIYERYSGSMEAMRKAYE